jgi:hypothetical protein
MSIKETISLSAALLAAVAIRLGTLWLSIFVVLFQF